MADQAKVQVLAWNNFKKLFLLKRVFIRQCEEENFFQASRNASIGHIRVYKSKK